ncbi:Pycsar system effector family protein [Methanobacterium formicicum]|uniref:Pycsar system effector family protein n=1 Tax=Methanobacterium formicicum TaxID=2162 RepID=UPI0024122717|nr:Pycsar system effector family protein [Methanobacterium formicicum]MDG3546260.1 DUF5706 domain-containing protein [Methanobacterium formicicum]
MKDNINSLWNIYNTVNEWIKFSDTKAAVVLATNGVILSLFFSNIFNYIKIEQLTILIIILIIIGTTAGLFSIIFAILCLVPNTNNYKLKSLIFFGDIAKFESPEKYSDEVGKKLFNDLKRQISQEIWINSRIASNKYDNVSYSIKLLLISILFLIMPFVIKFLFK